jgi:sugar lactone lactonase YvrE
VITTVAGGGASLGDNGPAISAQVYSSGGVAVDAAGNLYIADYYDNRVRKVTNGVITTVAGNGTAGFSGDNGPATSAQLYFPEGVALDSAGNLYITDAGNRRIRKVTNGVITTLAGNGTLGFSGDNGPATSAQLAGPEGLAVDSAGNLYIADVTNQRIRKVSNGVITTVAGGGSSGLGDNGPATSAQVIPAGVAVDSAGNLYIADFGNGRIRKVSNGVITTVAGGGSSGLGDNGPATSAQLSGPSGVAVDAGGNLYIADYDNFRIRKVTNGVITTVAGNGTMPGFSGDNGPATSAQFGFPESVAVDSAGNVYVVDLINNRIRVLTPFSPCTYSVSPTALQAPASGGNLTVSVQTTASCSWAVSGLPTWITVSGASSGTGSATVALVVAPNSGAAQSATISIAGVSVTINQAAAASSCTYAISPGGQAFAAAGGTGTINITAGAGCPWTAASAASWITITGVGTGSGNGSVTFQAAPNTGADRSGSVAVAGLSFTVEEAAASITGLASAGSMAQLASAGYWTTTITLVNTGSSPAQARLSFFDDNGNPLALPLSFPSPSGGAIPLVLLLASTLDRTVNPGAELVIQTTGANSSPTLVGWAQLLSNGAVGGYAVFSQAIGGANQEAEVPLENRNAGGYVVPFDNTNGSATGIALANISAQAANTAITIRDDTGAVILTDTLTLPVMGHTSFDLVSRYASSTAQRRGTLEFRTPTAGQISVLGLKFNGTGAFSTIPAIAK